MNKLKVTLAAIALVICFSSFSFGQANEGNVLINVHSGLLMYRNQATNDIDVDVPAGLEANFFLEDKITLTLGYEHLFNAETNSIGLGSRFYITDYFYARYKTNINSDFKSLNDFMFGLGNDFYMNDSFSFMVQGDYHLVTRGFGLRFGVGFLL